MSRRTVTLAGAVAALMLSAPGVGAQPAAGPHETVDVTTSTPQPGSSAGLTYAARYHAARDPSGEPPALRHLVIELPAGTRIDSSVPPRCSASDAEIMLVGEAACPASARVGSGEVTVEHTTTG